MKLLRKSNLKETLKVPAIDLAQRIKYFSEAFEYIEVSIAEEWWTTTRHVSSL